MDNFNTAKKYKYFRAFETPIEYFLNGKKLLTIRGYFPYRVVTLYTDNTTNHNRSEFEGLEEYLQENVDNFIKQNKYIIVADEQCMYLHDMHARVGSANDIRDYDFRHYEPIMVDEDYEQFLNRIPKDVVSNYRKLRGYL